MSGIMDDETRNSLALILCLVLIRYGRTMMMRALPQFWINLVMAYRYWGKASLLRDQAIRLQEIARAAERWANTRERLEALEAEKAAARKGVAEK